MVAARKSIFITFEGIEGSGKSTQIELLAEYLRGRGYEILVVREPGGTRIGDNLRDILLDPDFSNMNPSTELLLYAASRAQLVSERIKPALASGKIVLCDRFADSSIAYQGFGRNLPMDEIKQLNDWATKGLMPSLTVVLSIPTREGLGRATQNSADRIEQEGIDFHQRVEKGYEQLAKEHPDRIRLVDASSSPREIHQIVVKIVEQLLGKEEIG